MTASAGMSAGFGSYSPARLSASTAFFASLTHLIRSGLSPERLVAPERISAYRVLTLLAPRPLDGRGWNHRRSGRGPVS